MDIPYIFVGVFLIVCLHALVQEGIQAREEGHVAGQQRNNPDHNDHHNFDDCGVANLIFALTPWTEFLFLALDLVTHTRKNHPIAVAEKKMDQRWRNSRNAGEKVELTILSVEHCR